MADFQHTATVALGAAFVLFVAMLALPAGIGKGMLSGTALTLMGVCVMRLYYLLMFVS